MTKLISAFKRSIGKISGMLALICLLFLFQNCEEVDFGSEVTGDISTSEEIRVEMILNSEVPSDRVNGSADDRSNQEVVSDESDRHFRCTLAGFGQSNHLILANSNLASETGVPRSICMTKYACEKIVSKSFKVKSADYAVQCEKGLAGTVQLSDFEIEKLMGELVVAF